MNRLSILALSACLIIPHILYPSRPAAEVKLELEEKEKKAEGVSFSDYYRVHKNGVGADIARGSLNLNNKNLKDLTGFDVQHIPGLNQLRELRLSNNRLTALPTGIFSGLNQLATLYLDHNQLTALPAGIFSGLNRLQVLHLSLNQFTALPADIFAGLNQLQRLWLQYNQLAVLPVGIFSGLSQLQELILNGNQFTALPADIVSGLKQLELILLCNNPIPFNNEQLRKELQLPDAVELRFKTAAQEKMEKDLFAAIKVGDAGAVRAACNDIMAGKVRSFYAQSIDLSKIRTPAGDNLLHAIITAADNKRSAISGDAALTNAQKEKQLADSDKVYTKMFGALIADILSQPDGAHLVHDMLLTRNKAGDYVPAHAFVALKPNSQLVRAIFKAGEREARPAGEPAKRFPISSRKVEEKLEDEVIRNRREQKERLEKEKVEAAQPKRPESMPTQ